MPNKDCMVEDLSTLDSTLTEEQKDVIADWICSWLFEVVDIDSNTITVECQKTGHAFEVKDRGAL